MWLGDQYLRPICIDPREENKSSKRINPVIDVPLDLWLWHVSSLKISGEMANEVAEAAEKFPVVLVGKLPTLRRYASI